jgi:hypothetical protein
MEDRITSHFIENPGKSFATRFESKYYSAIVLRSKTCHSGIVYLSYPGLEESEKEEFRAKQSKMRDDNWECTPASTFGGPLVSGFESNKEEDWEPADEMDVVLLMLNCKAMERMVVILVNHLVKAWEMDLSLLRARNQKAKISKDSVLKTVAFRMNPATTEAVTLVIERTGAMQFVQVV